MSIQEIILNGLNSMQKDINLTDTFKHILKTNGDINLTDTFKNILKTNGEIIKPDIDMIEEENKLLILVEIPGMKEDEIEIEFCNNKLSISGEKINKYKEITQNIEISYGKFKRDIMLPISVTKQESVILKYINGILSITIDKNKERENSFKCQVTK